MKSSAGTKQDVHYTCNVTSRLVLGTYVAVEKQ